MIRLLALFRWVSSIATACVGSRASMASTMAACSAAISLGIEQPQVLHLRHAQLRLAHQRLIDPGDPLAAKGIDQRPMKRDVGLHDLGLFTLVDARCRSAAGRPSPPRGSVPSMASRCMTVASSRPRLKYTSRTSSRSSTGTRALLFAARRNSPSCTRRSTAALAVVRATENSLATETSVTATPAGLAVQDPHPHGLLHGVDKRRNLETDTPTSS